MDYKDFHSVFCIKCIIDLLKYDTKIYISYT